MKPKPESNPYLQYVKRKPRYKARRQAEARERQLLATTSLKDLITKKSQPL